MRAVAFAACLAVGASAMLSARESYRVTVTRKENNLYRIDGTKTYIKTRMCLELALGEDAILNYERGSFSNKLIFDKHDPPDSCAVERLLTED